jgi:hypothetical protein
VVTANVIKFITIFLMSLFFCTQANAVDYYLSPSGIDSGDCTNIGSPCKSLDYVLDPRENDGISARVDGGDGTPDTLYLRGGTYDCSDMTSYDSTIGPEIYPNNSETDATVTIKSYPGEWAILDGTGLNHVMRIDARIFNVVFENFEVRNAKRYGIDGEHDAGGGYAQVDNCKFRNLYIHDNNKEDGANPAGNNPAGLLIAAKDTIVEYCTFIDNGIPDGETPMHNAANLTIFQCYNTSDTNVDPYPRRNNIIRYNVFDGAAVGIKDKAYGNFVDSASPTITNPDWYGEIHHNVFQNTDLGSYYARQDYMRFHHNLILSSGYYGFWYAEHDDTPPKGWFSVSIYNNTFVGLSDAILIDYSNYTNYTYGYQTDIYNNLMINPSGTSVSVWEGQTSTWAITVDHNGYDNDNSTIAAYLNDGNRTLAQWQAYGYGTGSINEALSLEADYTLPGGSNAIGAGRSSVDLGAFPSGVDSWYDDAGYFGLSAAPGSPSASGITFSGVTIGQ